MSTDNPFKTGDKVFCYQGPLLYEAKILGLKLEKDKSTRKLFIHYNGWNKSWDEWVPESRVLRINDENLQKKRELESAQKKVERMKAVRKSPGTVVDKKKVSRTQENASQQNGLNSKSTCSTKRKRSSTCGLNPKSTCSTKRKRSSTSESDNESESSGNEDFTKVWKGCQALKSGNEAIREPGVPFDPCPECNERQIVEALRYKSIHQRVGQKATSCPEIVIWFKRLKDMGFKLTSIPDLSHENHTSSTELPATVTPKKTNILDADHKIYQCHMCTFSFQKLWFFKRHLQTHDGKCPHTCDLCQRSFARADALRSHQLTHSGEKSHHCYICNRRYSRKSSVARHIAAVHHKIRDENNTSSVGTDRKTHQCHTCSFFSHHLGNFKHHLRTHTGERPYTCHLCQRSFARSDALQSHQLTHSGEKPYQCSICNRCFTLKAYIRRHIAAVHLKIRDSQKIKVSV